MVTITVNADVEYQIEENVRINGEDRDLYRYIHKGSEICFFSIPAGSPQFEGIELLDGIRPE